MKGMFERWVVGILLVVASSASMAQDGIGVSSEIYAARFNELARQTGSTYRLRSDEAVLNQNAARTVVTFKLDGATSLHMGYGKNPKRMSDVILVRRLASTTDGNVNGLTAMLLATMAAFENPKAQDIGATMMSACNAALDRRGASFERSIGSLKIECVAKGRELMLSIS